MKEIRGALSVNGRVDIVRVNEMGEGGLDAAMVYL